jgi:hypothetical protein
LPLSSCGSSIDELPSGCERMIFHSGCRGPHFQKRVAGLDKPIFSLEHLKKIEKQSSMKALSLQYVQFNDFNLKEPLSIPSITSLCIDASDLRTTKEILFLFNSFPNLSVFEMTCTDRGNITEFLSTIKPRPLIKKATIPLVTDRDFIRYTQVFPNNEMKHIDFRTFDIQQLDFSQMSVLPHAKFLDIAGGSVTADPLYKILEKLPNVKKIDLRGCFSFKCTELQGRACMPSVEEIWINAISKEEKNILRQVFPNTQVVQIRY